LVIEDDEDVALYVQMLLQGRLDCEVTIRTDAFGFDEILRSFVPDVLLTDVELPRTNGLHLMTGARAIDPLLPIIVMTAHSSVDYAVRALRGGADEYLQKPLNSKELVSAVERLAEAARLARTRRHGRSVPAIGAHPDDVEIGVGRTLAAHAAVGDPISILTLSRGARAAAAGDRQEESLAAAELVGARLFMEDLTDTAIPGGDPTVGIIERVVAEVAPTTVYVHSRNERHQDHRAVHEAAVIATRRVENVACYQSPSTTIDFPPTRFVDIDGYTQAKLDLLACFASQSGIRDYLEPDSCWRRRATGRASARAAAPSRSRSSATRPASEREWMPQPPARAATTPEHTPLPVPDRVFFTEIADVRYLADSFLPAEEIIVGGVEAEH
jgi:LmbE family N-acetylglucosaminyl deacetylase/CheY-like chemotaxis protein